MKENGHYAAAAADGDVGGEIYTISIQPNNNTLKSVLDIDGYKVDFTTANSIRTVLGFNSQIYSAGYNESDNIMNIMNVNSLRVTSDVIGSSYSNGTTENVIYSFFPNVVDIQIKSTFNAAVPAGTEAYAVVISDKLLEFQSDGQKLSVV